jgi:flagellar motor switch/type III secretory pathway protein FliN
MSVRPYKLINHSEQAILAAGLNTGVRRWAARYVGCEIPDTCCSLVAADDSRGSAAGVCEWIVGASSVPLIGIGLAQDWPGTLADLLLAGRVSALDSPGSGLVRELATELLQECGQTVLELLLPRQALGAVSWSLAAQDRPTAGDARTLACCQLGAETAAPFDFWLELAPDTVLTCLAASAPSRARGPVLEPLSKAIQTQSVVLEAIAGEADLAVEELRTLAAGDVLKLNRRITEPLELRIQGGGVVCAARLGAARGRTALQLT